MPGQVWSILLVIFFTGWCGGGDHGGANQRLAGDSTRQEATPAKISLDFTPMTDPVSTFVSIKPDNQADVVRYSRSLLIIKSASRGVLSPQDVSKLTDKTRALVSENAICTNSFGSPGLTRGDQFHLTLNVDQKKKECFGFIEDAPPAIRSLVEDVLSTSQKLTPGPLADAYLRSEPISQNRYEALLKSTRLRFVNLEEFPNDVQQILSTVINHPRDFIALSTEQRKHLLDRITSGHELFVTHKSSGHQLTIFLAQK